MPFPPPLSQTPLSAAGPLAGGQALPLRRILLAGAGDCAIAAALARDGFSCDQVSDGALAIAAVMASDNQYAAVLLAVDMPVLGGLAAAAVLRAIGFGGPVLALTVAGVNDGAAAVARQRRAGFSASVVASASAVAAALAQTLGQPAPMPPGATGFEDLPAFAGFRNSFRAALVQRLAELNNAAAAGDWSLLARQAHNLKGSGGTFGFAEISRVATEIELAARAADAGAASAALERLRVHAALLEDAAAP